MLPTDGCDSAVVFDNDGNPTDRSMLYTEYFLRGTEPTTAVRSILAAFDVIATSAMHGRARVLLRPPGRRRRRHRIPRPTAMRAIAPAAALPASAPDPPIHNPANADSGQDLPALR
jgi:hypothetical protein